MPRMDIYIPENPGKENLLNQLETVRKAYLKEFGIKLTNSKIILLAVELLLKNLWALKN